MPTAGGFLILFLILKALHLSCKKSPETGDYLKGDQLYENFKSYNTLISLADFAASAFRQVQHQNAVFIAGADMIGINFFIKAKNCG